MVSICRSDRLMLDIAQEFSETMQKTNAAHLSQQFQTLGVDLTRLPRHVAVIMDGNGRWASARGWPRFVGHREGVERVREIVESCQALKIPYLTLYAFSFENWKRPKVEVSFLMNLLNKSIASMLADLDANNVRLEIIGEMELVPTATRSVLKSACEKLSRNTGMQLTIALSYSGRREICDVAKKIAALTKSGELEVTDITEELIASMMYTKSVPDPDLLIRTSGELRLSNFLLWQLAYSELVFSPTLWPDFRMPQFARSLVEFQGRDRRFGGVDAIFPNASPNAKMLKDKILINSTSGAPEIEFSTGSGPN